MRDGGCPRQERKRLREAAAAWEGQWGPEGLVKDGDFVVLEGSQFKPNYCAKFPHFANKMIDFDERGPEERTRRFVEEVQYAMDHDQFGGKSLRDIFNNEDWKRDFRENWRQFGGAAPIDSIVFRQVNPQ